MEPHSSLFQTKLILPSPLVTYYRERKRLGMEVDKKIEHFSHRHPLILKEEKQIDETIKCSGCHLFITDGPIYVCDQCQEFVLHKSCVGLPKEIQHPFHPRHPLVLLPKSPYESEFNICSACHCHVSGFVFRCAECGFHLDVGCASLEPTVSHECHHHLLAPFDDKILLIVNSQCVFCGQNIGGEIILRCMECNFNVHKSCAHLLPKQIQHPFHPDHPLTLKNHLGTFTCHACKGLGNWCSFSCDECHFNLHIECARLLPNIKCQGHEHLLTLIKKTYQHTLVCNSCGLSFHALVLACVQCDFYIHVHCNPSIPRTIKHQCHVDTLTLVDSLVEKQYRFDSNEFYCDACEKLRNPNEPGYYCAECQFMAEIRCVISEVLSPLTVKQASVLPEAMFMDSTSNGDEDDDDERKTRADEAMYRPDPILLEIMQEMKKLKLEERIITTQLESLALRLESLISQSEVLKAKADDNIKCIHESRRYDMLMKSLILEYEVSRLLKNKRVLEALQIIKNDM